MAQKSRNITKVPPAHTQRVFYLPKGLVSVVYVFHFSDLLPNCQILLIPPTVSVSFPRLYYERIFEFKLCPPG